MTWQPHDRPEDCSRSLSPWEPLPEGYNPVLPLLSGQPVQFETRIRPLWMNGPNNLPNFRNPRVGVFVPEVMTPPPLDGPEGRRRQPYLLDGNTHFQNPSSSYPTHAFAIGVDRLGDANARLGGDKITPIHGELPTDTTQTDDPYGEVIVP